MIKTDPAADDAAKALAQLPTELALGLLAITRALRPRTRAQRLEFDRRIRRTLARTPAQQSMLRTILKEAMR